MKKIGIIGAMRVEAESLRMLCTQTRTTAVSGIEFIEGSLFGQDVVLAVSGVGKVSAAVCTQAMILRFAPDCVINTGVAGGIGAGLRLMDVVVGTKVAQHDMDTSALGEPVGLISGLDKVFMDCDEGLSTAICRAAQAVGVAPHRGLIVSGDQFIASAEQIARIHKNFPEAMAAEMEGASIGQVCAMNGVPFAVIRAISDGGDEAASMNFPEFVKRSAERSIDILRAFLQGK